MRPFSWRAEPTRRDLLAAFLGVPLALAAGCSRKQPPLPEGRIIGPSDELGHKLRDGFRPKPEERAWESKPVVIVGGGVAGLAAAWRLLQAGFREFTLLELERDPGGTSRFDTANLADGTSCSYPWGAHYLPVPMKENQTLIRLLKEMGIVERDDPKTGEPIIGEEFLVRAPEARLWANQSWEVHDEPYLHAGERPSDVEQLKRFSAEVAKWVSWRDGKNRRAFGLPVARASDDAFVTELDKVSMTQWLDERGYTSKRLRWMVDYACRDDYGASSDDVSAWSGLFYFASRKRDAQLESQPFMVWPEGNGRLVRHFVAAIHKAGDDILRRGLGVSSVQPRERGVDVIAYDLEQQRAVGLHAEQVVFAAPQFVGKYLIAGLPPERIVAINQFEYSVWFVANLHLKDRPAGPLLAWDNILYDSPSLGYVVATHQLGSDHGPTILTYYYPMTQGAPKAARGQLLGMDWKSCVDVALTDLEQAHPDIRKLVRRIDVMRWGHAMPRPRPGVIWGGARQVAAQPYRGIHFAHSDLSGVGIMEEAFYQGVRAAEEVLTARNVRFESIL